MAGKVDGVTIRERGRQVRAIGTEMARSFQAVAGRHSDGARSPWTMAGRR